MRKPKKSIVKHHACNWPHLRGSSEPRLGGSKNLGWATCIFVTRALGTRNNVSTGSRKQCPPFLPAPHRHTRGLSSAAAGLSHPHVSAGMGVSQRPDALFSRETEMELNALPRTGWQAAFCDSYLWETPVPPHHPQTGRASLFCENWQRRRAWRVWTNRFPGTSRDNFLRKLESKPDNEATAHQMNSSSDSLSACHLISPGGVTMAQAVRFFFFP